MNTSIPNSYDPANAARLCQASAAAYGSGRATLRGALTDFQGSTESAQYKEAPLAVLSHPTVIESRATDTRVLLIDDGPDFIAAFRGTQDLRNWLTDIDCTFVPSSCGRVHAGFTAALNSVYAGLAETILDAHCAGKKIWLTGHSLGGALAMLAARQLIKPLAGCYTFGQPRVGDATFCDSYNALLKDRTHRVVHGADVVPRVPWLLGSFRHAGHEAFYPQPIITNDMDSMANSQSQDSEIENRSLKICHWQQDPSFLRKLPFDIAGLFDEFANGKLALLDDHHVATYLALFDLAGGAGACEPPNKQGVAESAIFP